MQIHSNEQNWVNISLKATLWTTPGVQGVDPLEEKFETHWALVNRPWPPTMCGRGLGNKDRVLAPTAPADRVSSG